MYALFLLLALLIPSIGHAAYLDQGMILRYEQDGDGSARLIVRFTGDAGEPIVDKPYPIFAPSTVIQGLAAASPAAVAKDVWRNKVESYQHSCSNSFVGSVATDCAALKANIESTYQAGYLDAP